MPFELRYYQSEAVKTLFDRLYSGHRRALACLPTGAGKSPCVAELVNRALALGANVCVVVNVKELVKQLESSILAHCGESAPVGVWSAGLGRKEARQVIVAGIQSIYKQACNLEPINLVIVDEAHMIPECDDGMYRSFLADLAIVNPSVCVVGLTATPYRMGTGLIYGGDRIFPSLDYDAPVKRLIDQGYLCPLRGKASQDPDLSSVHRRGGEFIQSELEACMSDEVKVAHAVKEMHRHGGDRQAWLVFCCGVGHAQMVAEAIRESGVDAEIVTGETPAGERDSIVARYKERSLRCLVNVNVLTTGFDAPHIDMVVMLRPTESPGLYYQIMGRGLRKSEHKTDCMVLDLAGNIARHGPIDLLNEKVADAASGKGKGGGECPTKRCPQCEEVVHAAVRMCPSCGHEWERDEARHDTVASDLSPVSSPDPQWQRVSDCRFQAWTKKNATPDSPQTLRVDYYDGLLRIASEWVCVEHAAGSYAHTKALAWLDERLRGHRIELTSFGARLMDALDNESPITAESIAQLGNEGKLRFPVAIGMIPDGQYQRIAEYDFGDEREPGADEEEPAYVADRYDDEPPF